MPLQALALVFFFITVSNMHRSGHVIAIFGNHATIATSGKMAMFVSNYQKNWSDFEEIMASK